MLRYKTKESICCDTMTLYPLYHQIHLKFRLQTRFTLGVIRLVFRKSCFWVLPSYGGLTPTISRLLTKGLRMHEMDVKRTSQVCGEKIQSNVKIFIFSGPWGPVGWAHKICAEEVLKKSFKFQPLIPNLLRDIGSRSPIQLAQKEKKKLLNF